MSFLLSSVPLPLLASPCSHGALLFFPTAIPAAFWSVTELKAGLPALPDGRVPVVVAGLMLTGSAR